MLKFELKKVREKLIQKDKETSNRELVKDTCLIFNIIFSLFTTVTSNKDNLNILNLNNEPYVRVLRILDEILFKENQENSLLN